MAGWLDILKDRNLKKVANRSLASTFIKSVSSDDVYAIVGASTSVSGGLRYKILKMDTKQVFSVSEVNFKKFYEYIYRS